MIIIAVLKSSFSVVFCVNFSPSTGDHLLDSMCAFCNYFDCPPEFPCDDECGKAYIGFD